MNLIGNKYGRLTVINKIKRNNRIHWECKCDCGNTSFPRTDQLLSGNTKSCGCIPQEKRKNKLEDLTGRIFGKLTVRKQVGYDKYNKRLWECNCECGNIIYVTTSRLLTGRATACKCRIIETAKKEKRYRMKHGIANMNDTIRCYKISASKRGLIFNLSNNELLSLFKGNCFYCDTPPSNTTNRPRTNGAFIYNGIDRVDNNKGYEDGNVVSCCKTCNMMKKTLSQTEFINHIESIHHHFHKDEVKNDI